VGFLWILFGPWFRLEKSTK